MKNVFLIGDSIRFGATGSPGYGVYVAQALEGRANVFQPGENCRWAQYTLRYAHEWAQVVDGESVDVVHWNNGLWDVLRLEGDDPFTPVEIYVMMLRRVHSRLKKLFPNARIIFATNTRVIEAWANPNFFRYNSEIEEYNAAACALMEELGVEVNDLYALTKDFSDDMHSDWVHFNEAGSQRIAQQVLEFIERGLSEN